MKLIRKLVYSLFIILVIAISSSVIATIIFKDEIINLLIIEVNKQIKTELEVDEIDLKLLKGFPNISIDFKGVKFYSAFEDEILLESKNVYFVLDFFELFNKNISVERLEIIDAKINIHVNKVGQRNFDVFVSSDTSKYIRASLNLESILLKNVTINTKFDKQGVINEGYISKLEGQLVIDDKLLEVKVLSNLTLTKTNLNYYKWLVGKKMELNTKNIFDGNRIQFDQSTVAIEEMFLKVNGAVGIDKKGIDMRLESFNLNFSNLLSALPEKVAYKLKGYNGKGYIDINAKLKGNWGSNNLLGIRAQVSLNDFEINNKNLLHPLEHINAVGEFNIKNLNSLSTGNFTCKEFAATVNNKSFTASIELTNFAAPQISVKVAGDLDVPWLLTFQNPKPYKMASSKGTVHVNVTGDVSLNKSYKVEEQYLQGQLVFKSVSLDSMYGLPLSSLNGSVIFKENMITLEQVGAVLGNSDMVLDGEINLPSKRSNQVYSDLKIQSTHINLEEIFKVIRSLKDSTVSSTSSKLKYSANLKFDIKSLRFLKFRGENLDINLRVDDKIIQINSSLADALGGKIQFSGLGSLQFNGDYYIKSNTQTSQIFLDSLFYVFDNFNQSFITSEAIKGRLDATIYAHMYFDKHWNFKRNLLYSDASLRIREGGLTNYEPVMSLSTYLNEEGENLAQLKFSNLENHIIIANDTVFISEMYVGTNVRNIKIGGYHTFSQAIDYRLAVSVINNKKDSDNQFGKVKTNKTGQLYFPFRVYGTTTDYKVVYDLKTARSNFFKGIKNEFKEIGRKKEKKIGQDSLTLEEDEYFDWDNE